MKKMILLSLAMLLSACSMDFSDRTRDTLYENDDSAICEQYPDRCLAEEGVTW